MLKKITDTIGEGVYLDSADATAKFILIGENKNTNETLIQSLKSKIYVVIDTGLFNYMDYPRKGADGYGFAGIIKVVPKELSVETKSLLTRYKTLIKSAYTNAIVLGNIQRKYKTKLGRFNPNAVSKIDRQKYNQNLKEIKAKASKLRSIDKEDKDDKAQDKLTIDEIACLSDIYNWEVNYFPI